MTRNIFTDWLRTLANQLRDSDAKQEAAEMVDALGIEELKLRRDAAESDLRTHLDAFGGGDMQVDLANLHSEYWTASYTQAFCTLMKVRRLSFRGRCPDASRSL